MSLSYKLIKNIDDITCGVRRMQDGCLDLCIPINPENTDYQEYLAWVAEGNEPLPADEPS